MKKIYIKKLLLPSKNNIREQLKTNRLLTLLTFILLFSSSAFSQLVDTYTTGTGSWVCPPGVTSVQVECWGAGGGGGFGRTATGAAGGGGGGGEYTISTLAVVPGTTYYYSVGSGGTGGTSTGTAATNGNSSCFSTSANCVGILTSAIGGNAGTGAITNSGGAGGSGGSGGIFSGSGSLSYKGGNGATGVFGSGTTFGGGGGGGGASTTGIGLDASGRTGGNGAAVGGGNGGDGSQNSTGTTGNTIGGGGAGGHKDNNNRGGSSGAAGQVRLTYTPPAPVNDNCASAIALTVNATATCTTSSTGTTVSATLSQAITCGAAGGSDDDVWYRFTATSTSHTVTATPGTMSNITLEVFSGSCAATVTGSIGCADATSGATAETLNLTGLTIGNIYLVRVYSRNNGSNQGTFTLCVTTPPPPSGCTNTTQYPSGGINAPTNNIAVTITTIQYQSEYNQINNMQAGSTYQFANSVGGYITIHQGTYNGPIVAGGNSPLSYTPSATGTYYVHYNTNAACGTASTGGTTTITCTSCSAPVPPANDNCVNAVTLTVNPDLNCGTVTPGTVALATNSGANTCSGTADDDVWYKFVATATAHTIELLNVSGSTTDLYHAVYSGAAGCGSLGTPLVCSDPNNSVVSGLTIGTTYYVRIYSFTATTGQTTTFNVCIGTPPPPPVNDNCASAIALTVNPALICATTTPGSIYWATNSGVNGCAGTADDDVWYSFVATSNAHNIQLLNVAGSTTDLYHAVYSGASGCGSLGAALICSDPNNSTVSGLTIGNTYYVQVYSYTSTSGQTSTFDICVTTPITATNTSCALATPLACGDTLSGTTVGTTGASAHGTGCTMSNYGVWYSFIGDGAQTIISTNPSFDIKLSIVTGSACGSFTNIVCTDSSPESATFTTIAGQQYYVYVAHYSTSGSTTGNFTIARNCIAPCTTGTGTGTSTLGCPNVVSGGLGLNGADPSPITCATGSCVNLEATYLQLGNTTSYSVSSIPYNPPYQFSCLANPVSVNIDDTWSAPVNLPFNFCFYGSTYNQCVIGSNGVLTFDMTKASTSSGYSFSNNLPSTTGALFANSIYGVYHDIDPSVGGEVGWELITLNSGCRALVASWSNVPMFSNNSLLYTGMMVLYENTNIIEVYIKEKRVDGTWNGGNAIVGVQNPAGTSAVVAPGRNGLDADWTVLPASGEAWRFTPSGASITTLEWFEGPTATGPVIGTTPTLNVCPTATTTYTAQITYTLCNGATIKETDQTTVTVSANKTWNGSAGTNWNTATNWTPAGVPIATEGVLIPNTINKPVVTGGAAAVACSLNIQNGATLTVNPANTITVTNAVNIAAGGDMIIENTGSLVQINNSANTGTAHIKRTSQPMYVLDYTYWNSPVTAASGFTVGNLTSGTNKIYRYTPTVANGNGIWTQMGTATAMNPTFGVIARAPGTFPSTGPKQTHTVNFTGTPNNGTITMPITMGTNANIGSTTPSGGSTVVTDADDEWNLIGNPYPSAIDIVSFLNNPANVPVVDGTVYLWTHNTLPTNAEPDPFYGNYVYNYTVNDYATVNSLGATATATTGGTLPTHFIGTGQSFFISAETNGNVTFNNSMRVQNNNTNFYRDANDSSNTNGFNSQRLWLNLSNNNGGFSQILVGYAEGASLNWDRGFDGEALAGNAVKFYSLGADKKLTIQGRPWPFAQEDIVPLGFKATAQGNYTIGIDHFDASFNDSNIYLEDKSLNLIHNLKVAPYSFTSTVGTFDNRFVLRYTENTLSNEDNSVIENSVVIYANEKLRVNSTLEPIKEVVVYDVLGRLLLDGKKVNANEFTANTLNPTNSTLIVKVTLENNTVITRKVIY